MKKTDQKWHINVDGKIEEVTLERWVWGVVYKDGTELHQFDERGVFHQIKEIDQDNVAMWVLYKSESVNGTERIDIVLPTDQSFKLIHKYRNFIFNANTPEQKKVRVYMFGYHIKGDRPRYNFIMPNDTIVQSHTDQVQLSTMGIQ